MKLIVGLGNPGKQYEHTRHNVGFMVLDALAKKEQLKFKYDSKFDAECVVLNYNQEKALFVKPSTYMNLSGEAVLKIINYYHIEPEDVLVFVDDINIDLGRLRLREKGGHGGHNGLKNIISLIHSEEFKRVRIGVGQNSSVALVDFVLGKFSKDEYSVIEIAVDKCLNIIYEFLEGHSYLDIMTKYNTQT